MRKLLLLAVIVTVAVIVPKLYLGPLLLTNWVANPGFETAGAGGLDVWASWTENTAPTDETVLMHSGAHAAKLEYLVGPPAWPAGPNIWQSFVPTPGHHMRLSFWHRGDGVNAGSLRFEIYDWTNSDYITTEGTFPGYPNQIVTGNASAAWSHYDYDFIVPAGCIWAYYKFMHSGYNSGGIATVYVDDVELIDFDAYAWTDKTADVLKYPAVNWDRGITGVGLTDLVAGTGILDFTLDNSEGAWIVLPAATELLTNGGFETAGAGAPDFFGTWAETAGDGAIADETVDVHGGGHAAKLTAGATANTFLHQYAGTVPGATYQTSFWTRGDGTNGGRYYIWDGTNNAYIVGESNTGIVGTTYALVSISWTAPAGCLLADQGLRCPPVPGGTAYFDDVSVKLMTKRLAGQYSPGHTNCLPGFAIGCPVKLTLNIDGAGETTAWIGRIASIGPSAGLYQNEATEVVAHDWMGYLTAQQLGIQTLGVNQRIDEGITTALAEFPIQPEATSFGTGVETFLTLFDTEDSQTTMASFFSKLARCENGRIYLTKNGTLVVEPRRTREANVTSAFTLDGTMSDLEVDYSQADVQNIITVRVYPARIDTVAVRIWDLARAGCPKIEPGETLTFTCPFRNPLGGGAISATSVTNPVTVVEFGSTADYTSNDLAAFLTQANEVGSNQMIAHLTNTSTKTGYLNDFQVYGLGIYHETPIEVVVRDDFGVYSGAGERRAVYALEQISNLHTGELFADYYKDVVSRQHLHGVSVRFNASQTQALAALALAAEVSQRFTLTEAATGVSQDFFINHLKYSLEDTKLICELLAVPASRTTCWIWDTSEWDNTAGEGWTL